jgi:hypothetical protein
MTNSLLFHFSNTTIHDNPKDFILIHSKIFSIIGILLIPIVLICLAMFYYCYKRYLEIKFHQELKQNDRLDIDGNDSSMKYQFIQ